MYVQGFLIPVPEGNRDKYIEVARFMSDIMAKFGATEIVEAWEEDVKDGKWTDFRQAVKAEDGEKIVFSWVVWPDKTTADAAHEKMMQDDRMQGDFTPPFDGKRMIWGGFAPVFTMGRSES